MQKKWSWISGGFLLGLVSIAAYALGGRLGTTGAYSNTVGKLTEFFAPQLVKDTFLSQSGGCGTTTALLQVDAQWMVVFGLFIGAWTAFKLSGEKSANVPEMWAKRFGSNEKKRYLIAFLGGLLMLYGARIAGGCTSGHVISGMSRMAVSGTVFGLTTFAVAIPTAMLIYRKGGR